ncbi:phage holin family protein [Tenacibaculum ovolyticum]|uniref:phage holin family protein n=1 Tax=Tenacibaculum ovolyticum TaxID=104270 RepID=UPI0022F38F09|nr:phage holin family protein [Tenacibaculum ovolyticum]WBX76592.1 phage holin family protein [Tenacibaculum ovolyticum]
MDKFLHLIFWLLALLSPLNGVLTTMVLLIIVDFITGSYAAIKNNFPIRSIRFGHTVSKFFIYNLVIISAYFLEKHIVNEVPFLKIIAGFIAVTEIKSILENYNKIYGVNPFKALHNLLKQTGLQSTLEPSSKKQKKKQKV